MKYPLLVWMAFLTISWAGGLSFENTIQEVNAELDAKFVTTDYKFSNTGEEDVTILTADGGCTCMKVEISNGKMMYKPGESGVLRCTFEVGVNQGVVNKVVGVQLQGDAPETPSHVIQLRINIPIAITITPKSLKWKIGDQPTPKSIRVDMDYKNPIHITSVSSTNQDFAVEIVEIEKGKKYDVKVTPKKMDASGVALIRIVTDIDIERHRFQQAFASVSTTDP